MKYILDISMEQAEIIKIALEEYIRLRMNQTWDFVDSLCFEGFDYENHTKEDFDERIERRDMFRKELDKLLNAVHPLRFLGGKFREQTMEMLRAQDIWQVIRQRLYLDRGGDPDGWSVDAREPMPMTDEELPKMKKNVPDANAGNWIPFHEDDPDTLPKNGDYILLSFEKFDIPAIGRYEDGAFYLGDCDEGDTCASVGLFVNAWMPLPEAYRDMGDV